MAVFSNHLDSLAVVDTLQKSGVNIKMLSMIGKDDHTREQVVAYYTAGGRMKYWGNLSLSDFENNRLTVSDHLRY